MLEGYIAPLFTGYVDKYIKNLKPGDLSLSLWGGDVVLQNLELNLDVLQKELNLPITFLSGKIHKFQLHVPWTRLIYEPVVVTIDTMEFVVKLRDPNEQEKPTESDAKQQESSTTGVPPPQTPDPTASSEQVPPGYVQGILNKVINNVSFNIKNIIIKYVEDDIVLSLNVKSVDFFCANAEWERAFIDLSLSELLLRKICNVMDLTICLDQRNTSGRIELYQDPVLYKCNLSFRVVSRYKGLGSTKPVETKVNLFCEQFDFSLTDMQIPIVLRLLKLVIGLYYGNLDLPGCNVKKHTAPAILEKHKNTSSLNLSALAVETKDPDNSWSSWAWSMVPGGGDGKGLATETSFKENINFCFGLYVTQTTLTLKATNNSLNVISSQRLEFSPVLSLELGGCILEFVSIGDILIDVNVGVSSMLGYLVGSSCVCLLENTNSSRTDENSSVYEDILFLKMGPNKEREHPLEFLQKSLFTDYLPSKTTQQATQLQNSSVAEKTFSAGDLKDSLSNNEQDSDSEEEMLHDILVKSIKSGSQLGREEILDYYGSFFMNYCYEMTLPDMTAGDIENIFLFPNTDEVVPEKSEKRLLVSSLQFILSTSFLHTVDWLKDICAQKLPQRRVKTGVFYDPFVIQQLQLGNFLSRKTTLEICNSSIYVLTNNHKPGEKPLAQNKEAETEAISVQLEHCHFERIDPMYPLELTAMLDEGKIVKLNHVDNMDSRISLNVEGLQSGLSVINMESLDAFTLNILQPVDFEVNFKSSLLPDKPDVEMSVLRTQSSVKCQEISFQFTKLHLLLYYNIVATWLNGGADLKIRSFIESLTYSVFHPEGSPTKQKVPLMVLQVKGVFFNIVDFSNLYCITSHVAELNTSLQGIGDSGTVESVPLFQMPASTSKMADIDTWVNMEDGCGDGVDEHAVKLRLQCHKGKSSDIQLLSMDISGAALNVDIMLYSWVNHKPTSPQWRRDRTVPLVSQTSSRPSNFATTPRRAKSYARVYTGSTASPSHHSKEKFKHNKNETNKEDVDSQMSLEAWFVSRINIMKAFNVKVDIGSFVLIFPEKKWPAELLSCGNIVEMISLAYQEKKHVTITNQSTASILTCLPKISVVSSQSNPSIFEESLPVSQTVHRHDTLPWHITTQDFAILTLLPGQRNADFDKKVQSVYVCRPVSCKIFLAASSTGHAVSRTSNNLGSISEQSDGIRNAGLFFTASSTTPERLKSDKKATIGFVLHADWSVCEWFINQNQLKLLVQVSRNVYESFDELQQASTNLEHQGGAAIKDVTPSTEKRSNKDVDTLRSVSSASTVDLPDNFSTLTGSSYVSTKKVSYKDVAASLWIQCTFPKVRLTILSDSKEESCYNQMTSEVDEFTLAFDYQDNTLELTNKISSFVVYYSVLRFDTEPCGWVDIKNGFIFCQKEKSESSTHINSKTFLSLVYRRSKEVAQTLHATAAEQAKSAGDNETNVSSQIPSFEEELVIKHEINVRIQSFDLVCIANPILSSVHVFTRAIKQFISGVKSRPNSTTNKSISNPQSTSDAKAIHGSSTTILTWPVVAVSCGSVRLIMPQGEAAGVDIVEDEHEEPVLLFHLHSIALNTSPVNPITKTVVDKPLYKYLKQCYREPLKKLKLWNVQYQLDINNVGLCTTTWRCIQSTLMDSKVVMGRSDSVQNPALEWNMQSSHEQPRITPIFDGFDLKSTIAPPLSCYIKNELTFGTSSAIEFHSPRPIKLYINSSQIVLSLQLFEEVNSLITEMASILDISTNYLIIDEEEDAVFEAEPPHPHGTSSSLQRQVSSKRNDSASNHLPPVECFGSISSVSIDLYRRSKLDDGATTINPVLLLVFVQPTFSMNTVHVPRIQFTMLDISATTSRKVKIPSFDVAIPSVQDYDLPVFSCGAGELDPDTGLPPPLLKTSLTLSTTAVESQIVIGKPITCDIQYTLIKNVSRFVETLSPILERNTAATATNVTATPETTTTPSASNSRKIKMSDISVSTKQIHLILSTSTGTNITAVNTKCFEIDSCMAFSYNNQHQDSLLEDIRVEGVLNGLQFWLSRDDSVVPILMPMKCGINADLLFERDAPELCVWLDCGIIDVYVHQDACGLGNTLLTEVTQCLQELPGRKHEKDVDSKVEKLVEIQIETTYDDLRNGSFDYVMSGDSTTGELKAMQIMFSSEDDHHTPVMTWKYAQPRIVTHLHVLPVPFYLPKEFVDVDSDAVDIVKVECCLQYWDRLSKDYITCGVFPLSENDAFSLVLCDTNLLPYGNFHQSDRWRVVIATSQNIERFGITAMVKGSRDGGPLKVSPVPATSLAACLKVDSLSCTDTALSFQLKTKAKEFKLTVCNNERSLLTDAPDPFKQYYLNEATSLPDALEVLSVSLSDITTSLVLAPKTRCDVKFETTLEVAVMDYSTLCWIDFITPTVVDLNVRKALTQLPVDAIDNDTTINLRLDEMDVLITQSAVHTLFVSHLSWMSMLEGRNDSHFLNHFILCNSTQDTLRLQQVDTDEDIVLESGQMYPYSWYSHTKQLLRFCMATVGDWKWSATVDISTEGCFVHHLEHKAFTSKVLVEVKKTGGLQRQVVFHGGCTFRNNLKNDIQVEVITQEAKNSIGNFQNFIDVSKIFILPSGVERPSFTASSDYIKQLRLHGYCAVDEEEGEIDENKTTSDNKEQECCQIFFPQDKQDVDICGKVKIEEEWLWIWVSIRENEELPGQLIITFNPFFMVRNHFSDDLFLKITSQDEPTETYHLLTPGKGHETEVFNLDPNRWFECSFGLPGRETFSKPPLNINTTMKTSMRENESSNNQMLNFNRWPYHEEIKITSTKKSLPVHKVHKASFNAPVPPHAIHSTKKDCGDSQVTCQCSLKWPTLPSIVIDLKPYILTCNLSCSKLHIRDDGIGCCYKLEPDEGLSPFFVRESISIGVENCHQKLIWSAPIKLKPGSTHVTIFDNDNSICHQLSVKTVERDGILVVSLRERFLFHNLSEDTIQMCPIMFHHFNLSQTLNEGNGYYIPPSCHRPFAAMNMLQHENADSKSLNGLAININLIKTDEEKDDRSDIVDDTNVLLSNHLVRKRDSIILSEDHLRESICLKDTDGFSTKPLVLTSTLNDGVINVFIAEDVSCVVNIRNHCPVLIAMNEDLTTKTNNRYNVLESNVDRLVLLEPGRIAYHTPSEFKVNFPKPTNTLEVRCQFALYSTGTVELSSPLLVNKETASKVFIPGYGHVHVYGYIQHSRLFIELHKEEKTRKELIDIQPLPLPRFKIHFSSLDFIVIDAETNKRLDPLLSASLTSLQLIHDIDTSSTFKLSVGSLQVDNQIQEDNCYHFPVVLLPMRELSQRYHTIASDAPFPELEACSEADFCSVTVVINQRVYNGKHSSYVESVKINVQPSEMYLEDMFVYRVSRITSSFVPVWTRKQDLSDAVSVIDSVRSILFPVMVCNIDVGEVSILLSVHASVKMFLAADHIPLILGRFTCTPTQTVRDELTRAILYHYATQVLVRVGWIVGSLEIIGNPTGFIHSVARGLSDFFVMPYQGLTRGPTAFVSGIHHGMSSFLRHVSTGTLTSITNVSSSISRNLDRLCFDETHFRLQEQRRSQVPTKTVTGLQNAFGSLGMSLLGAVAGLVDHSIQNVSTANTTREAVTGIMTGFAKGVVGVVTKPIGGAMEFVSQTSQGILQGTGLVRVPERLNLLQFEDMTDIGRVESQTKFIWQHLHMKTQFNVYLTECMRQVTTHSHQQSVTTASPANQPTTSNQRCWLVITPAALFLFDGETNSIQSAFPLSEITLVRTGMDGGMSSISIYKDSPVLHHQHNQKTTPRSLDENPNFRQFFESFHAASLSTQVESMYDEISEKELMIVQCLVDDYHVDLLMLHFKANKCALSKLEESNVEL